MNAGRRLRQIFMRRKRLLLLTVLAAGVVSVIIWRWLHAPLSSEQAFGEFVAAIECKDVDTIYGLILDEEKRACGVTKQVISRALNEMLYKRAAQVKAVPSELDRVYGERADGWHTRAVAWADAVTGKYLPSSHVTGRLQTPIDLFLLEDKWQVSFTRFALSYIMLNYIHALNEKGVSLEQMGKERRARQAAMGITKILPDPEITKKEGRWVVVRIGSKEFSP